ncbi:membrane protein [Acidovorax sp. DW039]|uniref:tetratricopeptide repeat protein n=1 Tax=Acidovorax sp. DW039 TaxID=3095606 RepID=UPI00308C0EC1|nr:membrane protein [Acidovorax sp. DW039]
MLNTKWGISAIAMELTAWAGPALLDGYSDAALLSYLLAHAAACVLLAVFTLPLLKNEQSRPRLPMLALMAVCSYAVPIAGFVGVFVGTVVLRLYRATRPTEDFHSVHLPEFDLHQRIHGGFRQTGLRAVLGNSEVPARSRMRAMVALQHMSGRISSPLLRNVLNDSSEDLRLLAYGMLDALERNLSRSIDQELSTLREAEEKEGTNPLGPTGLQAAEKLSALYWELVYQNLAQGDMRSYAINESLRYCEQVLAQQPEHAQHTLRRGLLLHAQGRMDDAEQAYERALELGLPATRVLPYLAELRFEQRDFTHTRQLMQQLDEWSALPRLRPVIDYWRAR